MNSRKTLVRQTLAVCALLLFPFNNTLINRFFLHVYNPYILILVGLLLLLPDIKKYMSKATLRILLIETIVIILLVANIRITENLGNILIQFVYLLILPVLANIKIDNRAVGAAMTIFTIEHILGTAYPILLPELYESSFLSLVCQSSGSYCPARIAFNTGMNAGITAQSSTNGCYMAIFALFHAVSYMQKKEKKSAFLAIITIVCLLIIGKRAHLVFTILSLLITYMTSSSRPNLLNQIRKNIKIIIILIVSAIVIFAVSSTIPQITSTINRIIASKDSEDITSRRGPLYELAINKWKEKPMLGNGWGAYVAASHEKFGSITYGSDYMHAHNDYLEVLCDTGLIGLAIYLAIICSLFVGSYKNRNNGALEKFAYAYLMFYILYSLTGTPLHTIPNYVLLLVTILIEGKSNEEGRSNNI